MTCHFARRDEISIVSLDPYPRAHPRWPLGDGPSYDAPARPLPNPVPCVSLRISRPSTRMLRTIPPPASRAATARIANSYAAKVMADAGALFTSPGANPL